MEKLVIYAISLILRELTPELIKKLLDQMLDYLEDLDLAEDSQIDDVAIGGLCNIIRFSFGVADNDDQP